MQKSFDAGMCPVDAIAQCGLVLFTGTLTCCRTADERALLLPRGPYDFGISLHSQRRASAEPLAESQTGRANSE